MRRKKNGVLRVKVTVCVNEELSVCDGMDEDHYHCG